MRRLRENATLEPEINKTGDVVVEGHVIGRLDGFQFVADASAGGSEAKALHNAAQKALVGEIGARAMRLAEAPDGQFALASDGAIRWTGAAVGKLIAGEQVLKPRVRVIADEHLTGAPRDAVEARLEAFVKSHLEKLLGPLFVLSAAEDVTGIARGVAFQLAEALGVLERQKVAEDVKGLEQPARASLRKYGVRFGAYHIYIPALLKPGPRALAAQLWALAHDGPQTKGLDDLLHLAGSGRTSIPVNREIDAALYGTAGYRVSGERAVRVDILERLADLIRPALSWREDVPGTKPPGAIAGGGFTVVNGMTSLTGASGEDFASILRSLGYRMERRPKPAEPAQASAPAEQAAAPAEHVAAPVETASPTEINPDVQTPPAVEGEEPTRESAPEVSHAAVQEPVEAALQPAADFVTASPTAEPGETETTAAPSSTVAEAGPDIAADKPADEPVMIEVWRPGRAGRPEGARRPRFKRREAGRHKAAEQGAPRQPDAAIPAVAAAEAAASPPSGEGAATTEQPHAKRHQRHHRRQKPEQRFDRPPRERDRERPARPQRFERRERDKPPDPNSPFAKLAALKAQLEADAKERR
jgi:ATP-dependent RNA helicase SUPV3L1/SUV3